VEDREKATEDLEVELRAAEAAIDAAYWAFTRQARAKPPCLVVPWAYERRAAIRAVLSERRRASEPLYAESVEPRVSDVAIGLSRPDTEPEQVRFVTLKSRNT
jgi:hypothetical protein